MSRNSQHRRLTRLFRAHGLMIADEYHAPREALELPAKESEDIKSTLRYLVSMHGGESIHRVFGKVGKGVDWPKLTEWEVQQDIWTKLNLRSAAGGDEAESDYSLKTGEAFNTEGFRRVTFIENMYGPMGDETKGALTLSDNVLRLKSPEEAEPEPIPMDAFVKALPDNSAGSDGLNSAQMTLNWTQKGRPYRIIFTRLSVQREPGKPTSVRSCSCLLMEQ